MSGQLQASGYTARRYCWGSTLPQSTRPHLMLCLPAAAEVVPKLERILGSPYCTTKPQMQTLDPPPVEEEPQVVPSYGSASHGPEGQEAADVEPQESHTFPGVPVGEHLVTGNVDVKPQELQGCPGMQNGEHSVADVACYVLPSGPVLLCEGVKEAWGVRAF